MRKLTLLLSLVFLCCSAAVQAAPVATVTGVQGAGYFRKSADTPYQSLARGQQVAEGNWVKSGKDGWIELTMSDKSRFTIANNSELQVTRFLVGKEKRDGAFNLVQGKLRASVVKLAGRQTDIRVQSGTAVAGVKGTEFFMLAQGPANVFFGNEGTVSVSGLTDDQDPLPPDAMLQNTRGNRPVPAVQVEPGTALAQAKAGFAAVTGPVPPKEWSDSDNLPNIIARWDLNHGHYLADSGRYQEALQVFQIALDLSTVAEIRADARLERGGVYGRFLEHPEAALGEYLLVLEEYPALPQKEGALFFAGQTLYQMGRTEQALARLRQYLAEYPAGKHRGSVETLLRLLEK